MSADHVTEAQRAALAAMTSEEASLVHDATVGAMGGTLGALAGRLGTDGGFTDEQLYGLVRKSLPRMLEQPGGVETLLAISAVSIARTLRREWINQS
jgi:hypothetical protein